MQKSSSGKTLLLCLICLVGWFSVTGSGALPDLPDQSTTGTPEALSPYAIIDTTNSMRTGGGLGALIVDPILMQTAQSTAEIMAANNMHGHIGDVRGRVTAAGYGAGDTPWATENIATLPLGTSIDRLMGVWADALHMKPVNDPNYRHIGVGVAVVDDMAYYVLHAAYTSNQAYKPNPTPGPGAPLPTPLSQYIQSVETVMPQPDGSRVHVVQYGQSLWSIAIAYDTHIVDLLRLNGIPESSPVIYTGQELVVPSLDVTAAPVTETAEPAASPDIKSTATRRVNKTSLSPSLPASPAVSTASKTPAEPETAEPGRDLDQKIAFVIGGMIVLGLLLIGSGMINRKPNG